MPEFLFSRPLITTNNKHNIPHGASNLRHRAARYIGTPSNHVSESPAFTKNNSMPLLGNIQMNEEIKRRVMENRWGRGMTIDIGLWEDNNAPVVKIKTKENIDSYTKEVIDVLTEELVGACSSFLSKSPDTGLYVVNKCELMRMNLKDVSVLRSYRYLQYIDLANNNISNIKPLSELAYLIYLNVARNKLNDVLRFTPPWYLTYVNLAHNQISKIDDLSDFWSIVRLDLSHNVIERIEGLENLKHLKFLNLGYNLIECVENLDNLNIHELNLEYNCITTFKSPTPGFGIATLSNLRTLILRHNKLSTLQFFEGVYGLRYIDLKYNKITDLLEVSHLKSLVYEVDLRGNPCTKWPSYRDVLLFSMPSVMFVDGASVTISEKVSASTLFAPPMELIVARSVTKLLLLEHLNAPNIDLYVTQFDQSTQPLIILSGPPAVKKSILARQIADCLSDRVKYCASHTTRQPTDDNCGESNYHFVSREEFNEITRRGEFLSTVDLLGNSYGFHVSEIAALVLEKKIGITHMDLHGALQMQGRYTNAKLILVLTESVELHRQWIEEKFEVSTWVKSSLQNLITIRTGRHYGIVVETKESTRSKIGFIDEIPTEAMEALTSPLSNINLGSPETETSTINVTSKNRAVFPNFMKPENEIEMEKKHISFRAADENFTPDFSSRVILTRETPTTPSLVGLKIILDEQSNVMIENEEVKKKRQRAKVLQHHNSLHLQMETSDNSNLYEYLEESSVLSDDSFLPKSRIAGVHSPKVLEQHYSDLVIKSRDLYLQQHLANLGCFSLVVFTNEFRTAYNQVVNFIYECYVNQPRREPIFSTEIQELMKTVIPMKTKAFLDELTK